MPTQAEIDSLRKVDGTVELDKLAKQLCKILGAFAPIIKNKFADNETLMLALASAETMCAILPQALRDIKDYGGDNSSIDGESIIPGEDPDALPPYFPD